MTEVVPTEMIRKKRFGKAHTEEELKLWIQQYVRGDISDYHMSAWLMAVCFQGMTLDETANFTKCIRFSGATLNFEKHFPGVVDKHSTGGVGDKTSLILAPLIASFGLKVPMIAGRGLAHTGGTLDKLEAIPGFNVNLTLEEFESIIHQHGYAIIGQTEEICPADKKLYALRDVTGTVDSFPLICGSILSKKLAEGISSLVMDVKFGSGAFMKTEKDAINLAEQLISIGELNGIRVHALITTMEEPLGSYIGNSLEVLECLEIMQGKQKIIDGFDFYSDTRELTLKLAGEMLYTAQKASTPELGYEMALENLENGQALRFFEKMVQFQGGDLSNGLSQAESIVSVVAKESGFIQSMNVEKVGLASLHLGAGRLKTTDSIDPSVGIEMRVRPGQKITKNDILCNLHINNSENVDRVSQMIQDAILVDEAPVDSPTLIKHVIRSK